MGLDMFLTATFSFDSNTSMKMGKKMPKKIDGFAKIFRALNLKKKDVDCDFSRIKVTVPIAYWRKAHPIHKWFVNNVQMGIDECQTSLVEVEQLEDLRDICCKVVENKNSVLSHELLPYDIIHLSNYDDFYYRQVEYTSVVLNKTLNSSSLNLSGLHRDARTFDNVDIDFYYHSSW